MNETALQLEHLVREVDTVDAGALLHERLTALVNELINSNFDQLVGILYRMDINEGKLKQLLIENPAALAGNMIASMMIERQMQKVKSKKEFRQPPPADPEERW